MNVWFAIPTCRPTQAASTLERWKAMGYKTAVLVKRPDLVQFHDHWQRDDPNAPCPEDLQPSMDYIQADDRLYQRRKASGFPGHEPSSGWRSK